MTGLRSRIWRVKFVFFLLSLITSNKNLSSLAHVSHVALPLTPSFTKCLRNVTPAFYQFAPAQLYNACRNFLKQTNMWKITNIMKFPRRRRWVSLKYRIYN